MRRLMPSEIDALLSLLADLQPNIAASARQRLRRSGGDKLVHQQLAQAARSPDPVLRGRARLLLEEIQLDLLTQKWKRLGLRGEGELDLESGAILLGHYECPTLDAAAVSCWLDEAAHAIGQHIVPGLTMYHVIGWINTYVYETYGFRGKAASWHDPESICLDRVIEHRQGTPIALSVLYLLIARRLALPIMGVAMPGHFLLQYAAEETIWIDPFHRGRILTESDCAARLEEAGFVYRPAFLEPVGDREILRRMLTHVHRMYQRTGQAVRAGHVQVFLQMLTPGLLR